MVFESYAALARTARVRTHLAPLAGHFAADRLAALTHARAAAAGPVDDAVPQVLFVDAEDTGRTQIAATLVAHYAHGMVVARSAGFSTGEAVDPRVVDVLVARGIDTRVRALYEQIRVHPPARLQR
ncbi:hypothetical protein RCG71_17045 [Kocuria sp. CPCC 205281]